MKKIYILAAAALALSACSDDDRIFDDSAAERLEKGKKEFTDLLCSDGGKWVMEYFTTSDEPGYNILCQFDPDGSVVMSGDHQWINNMFQSQRSLWKVISDNGTVLSFNTYNDVFHIFSTPEDIPGTTVNELGYGHAGDYEFLLMPPEENTIRLIGKKHGLTLYMHRLPAETDPEEYLAGIRSRLGVFSSKFPVMTLTDASGETYSVSGLSTGVISVLSDRSTSPNSQTATGNGIFTPDGFRFMQPMDIIAASDSVWQVSEFQWMDDGSLLADRNVSITAPPAGLNLQDVRLSWQLDKESMSPALTAAHDAANNALVAANSARDLRNVSLAYANKSGKSSFALVTRVGRYVCNDYINLEINDANTEATLTFDSADRSAQTYNNSTPELLAFKQLFYGTFTVGNASAMNAAVIKFVSTVNPDIWFSVNVQ